MSSKVAKRLILSAIEAISVQRKACLLRTSCVLATGYTLIHFRNGLDGSGDYKAVLTHRFIYERVVGPIPGEMEILHSCDVRNCFNPLHLFIGTPLDNMADMVAKDRHGRGERQPAAKITADDVRSIRQLASDGKLLQREIGALFGLKAPQTNAIIMRRAWAHIP
jgi:hypothetical protein